MEENEEDSGDFLGNLDEVVERNIEEKKEYYVNLSSATPKRSHKKVAPSQRKSDKSVHG